MEEDITVVAVTVVAITEVGTIMEEVMVEETMEVTLGDMEEVVAIQEDQF